MTIILGLLASMPLYAQDAEDATWRAERPKVGVVLSGGGAKGMAHIGVLKVIEELGIPVDYVVGTSIGSIMAGFYALGYKADELDSLVRSQDWDMLMKDHVGRSSVSYSNKKDDDRFLITFPFMNRKTLAEETEVQAGSQDKGLLRNMPSALVTGHNLDHLFTKLSVGYQDDIDFNDLPIPFACVAVDLNTKEEVVWHRGNIVTAIRSSMSIPGYFAPVEVGDKFLVDGGMLNNLPVDVVKEMGADYVITVDLHHFKKSHTETDQTIPEMFSTMLSIMNGEKYQAGRKASTIIVEPNTSAYGVLSFDDRSVAALVDSGLVAAERVRPELQALADMLKAYSPSREKRPPKAIDLGRDSVLVSQLEISGTDGAEMNWLLSKTDIAPGKVVSGEDLDNAMALFYNTRCFRKVSYTVAGNEDEGYRLKVNFLPQRVHQAGVGFRFDSEEMASILLGVSLNKYKLFGSKLDTKIELGANPHISVAYGYTFRNLTRLNVEANASVNRLDAYGTVFDNDGTAAYNIISTDRYNTFTIKTDYQVTGWRNADIKVGVKYDNFATLVIGGPGTDETGDMYDGYTWQGYANWHFDNLDNGYFPTHGFQLNLLGAASRAYGEFFYDARLDFKAAIPLSGQVTLIPQMYNRWIFGEPLRPYRNLVGGYMQGRYLPWHLPFIGINHAYYPSDKLDILRADLRINLFRQHYLTLAGNYMAQWDFDAPHVLSGSHFGAAAIYSVNTVVGPVQFCTHWSNLSKTVGFYFSFGYEF